MRITSLLSVLVLAGTCWAQQGVDVQAPGVRVQTDVDRSDTTHTDTDTARTHEMGEKQILRASELIGKNVENNADETVGEINDVVIDPDDGRVRYVALSVGGFLGIADTLYAVPWTSFECRREGDQKVVILNVDKETLRRAKGFQQENWPETADEQLRTDSDRVGSARSTDVRATQPGGIR